MVNAEIFDKAFKLWGLDAQLDQAVEECAEFIVARNHLRRTRIGLQELMEEVVDVYIMMEQIETIDPNLFEHCYNKKMNRLEKRILNG